MKLAACYIRVSTDDQLEYSPDSQLEKIKEYCLRNDYILNTDNIFIEGEGVSGRKASKRQEFQHMIAKAKSKPKPFDVIIVWKFSRFARNREDSIVYKSMLKKIGIDVVSVTESIGDDKISVITEAIIEAMDEYYSINLGEEVRRGMTERTRHGKHNSSAPYGYKIVNKELVIDTEKAEIIREVFSRYLNGWGQKQIATWLNTIGVTTLRGGKIENRTVRYWLTNPVYHGYVRWNPVERASVKRYVNTPDTIVVKGSHEPIIDEETWNAVQKRIGEVSAKFNKNRRENIPKPYALSGMIKCSSCGASLARVVQNKYMQCINYSKGTCKVSHHCGYNDMWLSLLTAIEQDLTSGDFKLERAARPKVSTDSAAISAQLERSEIKLQRIREAYEAGIDTIEEYRENKAKITAEIAKLREKLDQIPTEEISAAEKKAFAEQHLKLLDKLKSPDVSELEKNHILKEFIKCATYSKADSTLSVIYLL